MPEIVIEHCQTHFDWGNYEKNIPQNDIVRVIKKVVSQFKDKLDDLIPVNPMGRKRHSRENMLAVILFAYMDNTRKASEIYERIQYDDRYKYLCDGITPSYTSIKDYRKKLEEILPEVNKELLNTAYQEEYTSFDYVTVDGTSLKSYNSYANVINEKDVETLKKIYSTCHMDKEYVDSLRKNGKKFLKSNKTLNEKLELLDVYEKELQNSNHTVTPMFDTDAKFMENKKGYSMLGHNVQFVTDVETKLITAIHVSNAGSDTYLLPAAMDKALESMPVKPSKVSADSAYRNEISSQYVKNNELIGYFPTKRQAKERKGHLSKNKFHKDNMTYDYDKDVFICYNNQELSLQKTILKPNEKREKLGLPLEVERTYYNKKACACCPYKKKCFTDNSKYRKIVDTGSKELIEIQKRMDTPEGKKTYKGRSNGESPIGTLRQQQNANEIPVIGSENIEKRLYWDVLVHNIKILYNLGYNLS